MVAEESRDRGLPEEYITTRREILCNQNPVSYTPVFWGFVVLGGLLVFVVPGVVPPGLVPAGLRPTVILGAAAFYASVGIYLFSQANGLYSIAVGLDDPNLWKTASHMSRYAYSVAAGAGAYLAVGVLSSLNGRAVLSAVDAVHLVPVVDMIGTLGLLVLGFLAQLPVLYGVYRHGEIHRWFAYAGRELGADRGVPPGADVDAGARNEGGQ